MSSRLRELLMSVIPQRLDFIDENKRDDESVEPRRIKAPKTPTTAEFEAFFTDKGSNSETMNLSGNQRRATRSTPQDTVNQTPPCPESPSEESNVMDSTPGEDSTNSDSGDLRTPSVDTQTSDVTPPDYEEMKRELQELRRVREEMRLRNMAEAEVRKSGNTVRAGGKRPDYGGVDAVNYTKVNQKAADWFEKVKFVGPDLGTYTKDERSLCQRILKGLHIPYEFDEKSYYLNKLSKMFLMKMRTTKTNFTAVTRESFFGECIVREDCNCTSRINFDLYNY